MFTNGTTSRLAVAVSVTVALTLAVFLTILVLLLADLFCARLRRNRLRAAASAGTTKLTALSTASPARTVADDVSSVATTTSPKALASTPPFCYAQGVAHAPNHAKAKDDLLLAVPRLESAVWKWSPARRSGSSAGSPSTDASRFLYISNPVYELGGQSPTASPLGITEEKDDDEEAGGFPPPLSAMRKLPPSDVVACPPVAMGFGDGRPSLTVSGTNRASSSSANFTGRFFSSWPSK